MIHQRTVVVYPSMQCYVTRDSPAGMMPPALIITLVPCFFFYTNQLEPTMATNPEFSNPLRKFKLVFLGEQSGNYSLPS